MTETWSWFANVVNMILHIQQYLSISQKRFVNAALDFIIKFQHEHIWVIFQLTQGLTGFIGKIMYKQI